MVGCNRKTVLIGSMEDKISISFGKIWILNTGIIGYLWAGIAQSV
jgi:hypothetical protein